MADGQQVQAAFDPNASYTNAPQNLPDGATHFYDSDTKSIHAAPLTETDAASGNYANQQAADSTKQIISTASNQITQQKPAFDPNAAYTPAPKKEIGVGAGVRRNTVGVVEAIHHALSDPVTPEESTALLQKIREHNQSTDVKIGATPRIPEESAQNPSKTALAYHRIIDAPVDVLLKKSKDEVEVAKDLLDHHEYWKGSNLYLSGLADRGLAAVPLVGPAINSIAERAEGSLIPAIDKTGKNIPVSEVPEERKDFSGAATDVGSMVALEHAPAIVKGALKTGGKAVEAVNEIAGKAATKVEKAGELKPEFLTKRPETPAPQHGAPVKVESPLDGPTVGKQLGGKDLSQEALDTLQKHVGEKIPVGSTAKNRLTAAVEPTANAINETASKMNKIVNDAPNFTTSVMQDNVFGEGKFTDEIEALKKNLPPSVKTLAGDVDAVMEDADKALNSNDPSEVLEYRRKLGNQIDWDKIEKNPTTPAEIQNATRAKVYRALGEKIHSDIPETVELDKQLSPNLELRSHIRSKLGDRIVDDPHAATAEAQSEFRKGKTAIDNAVHNETVAKNWQRIKYGLISLGVGSGIIHEIEKFL